MRSEGLQVKKKKKKKKGRGPPFSSFDCLPSAGSSPKFGMSSSSQRRAFAALCACSSHAHLFLFAALSLSLAKAASSSSSFSRHALPACSNPLPGDGGRKEGTYLPTYLPTTLSHTYLLPSSFFLKKNFLFVAKVVIVQGKI
jgi:hypothetical protein